MTGGGLAISGKLLLGALVLTAAVPAYRYSELSYLRENEPQSAYAAQPADARALVQVFGERLAADPAYVPDADDRGKLRLALITRPLSAELLAVEGLAQEAAGDPPKALSSIQLANRVSRRSVLAGLWLIEASTSEGDVPEAIGHYNNVLAAHPSMGETLLPLLARGIAFPEIRAALAPYIARPANWTGHFLQVAAKESSPSDLQALFTPFPASLRDEAYQIPLGSILQRLAAEAGGDAAAGLAEALVPGLDRLALSELAPSNATLDPRLGPMAWQFPQDGGIAVEARGEGMLNVTVQPLANGLAALRDVLVEGGKTYTLTQRVAFSSSSSDLGLTWRASCNAGGETISFWEKRLVFKASRAADPQPLKVPAQCRSATFALLVEGPDSQSPVTASLSDLELKALD